MTSDTGAWKQTIFYPFEIISNCGRGNVLHTLIDSPTYESSHGDASYLDAVVVEGDDTLTIFAVNKDLSENLEINCDLRQYSSYTVKNHQMLHHPELKARNTENDSNQVVPTFMSTQIVNSQLSIVLLSQRFHMIKLEKT